MLEQQEHACSHAAGFARTCCPPSPPAAETYSAPAWPGPARPGLRCTGCPGGGRVSSSQEAGEAGQGGSLLPGGPTGPEQEKEQEEPA